MGFDLRWTRDIADQKAREDFEAVVRNSTLLLTRLKQIIEEREKSLLNLGLSQEDFKDNNWSHKQAHRNGGLGELKRIKELIPF